MNKYLKGFMVYIGGFIKSLLLFLMVGEWTLMLKEQIFNRRFYIIGIVSFLLIYYLMVLFLSDLYIDSSKSRGAKK